MTCDIIVRAAQFEVLVVATRELLFHNEIFQPAQQMTLNQQANFLMQDCEVHSLREAIEWVAMNTQRLQAKVGDVMRSTLNDMGWQIRWVNALNEAHWEVRLAEANGEERQDQSLIQVPRG